MNQNIKRPGGYVRERLNESSLIVEVYLQPTADTCCLLVISEVRGVDYQGDICYSLNSFNLASSNPVVGALTVLPIWPCGQTAT